MTTSNKTPFGLVIGLAAALQGAGAARADHAVPEAPRRLETLTMSGLIARVRQDPALRARLADGPRAVLLAYGIDPKPFNLPGRLTEAQLVRFLSGWPRIAAQADPPDASQPKPTPPAVVYGPPAGPRKSTKPRPKKPAPPAPIYGPPAGTKQP
jgi:hypothetical protein